MATDEELKAWAAGEDVEGARAGRGRSGIAAHWWATQAFVVGFVSIYLAITETLWWVLLGAPSVWQASRAVVFSRRQRTWERLYGDGTTRRY